MSPSNSNLLRGTLDVLILKVFALQPMHGLGIANRIRAGHLEHPSRQAWLTLPTLHRMEEVGWLTSSWGESENNRRPMFYRPTAVGHREVKQESDLWGRISAARASALKAT